jgi:hypothetical protein
MLRGFGNNFSQKNIDEKLNFLYLQNGGLKAENDSIG